MSHVAIQSELEALAFEIRAVFDTLEETIHELYPPLSDLVLGQLKQVFTPLRVAVILTSGVKAVDLPEPRKQRIDLASALEMLYLALTIHKLLLADSDLQNLKNTDKSRIGSIILAGDYCFSRSAILAARTNNPQVVKQFAEALKTVSEGHLRRLFKVDDTFDEEQALIEAGLTATAILTNVGPQWADTILTFGKQLLLQTDVLSRQSDRSQFPQLLPQLPPWQQIRWQALLDLPR